MPEITKAYRIEKSNLIAKDIERDCQKIYDKNLSVNEIQILAINIRDNCANYKTLVGDIN